MMSSSGGGKKRKLGEGEQKFYAVRAGKEPGVYMSWKECQENTTGFKGASCEYPLLFRLLVSLSSTPCAKRDFVAWGCLLIGVIGTR